MKTKRSIGALMLFLSAQASVAFAPNAAANESQAEPKAVAHATAAAPKQIRLVLADPSWDAFVFTSAAVAVALDLSQAEASVASRPEASWTFLAAEPQFDYLAALTDVGMIAPQADAAVEGHWLS